MDESAQQAVQISVNITIFVVALTVSITLLLGVRDVADVASEYNASIPTGSRVVTVADVDRRIISGDELLSYYANYMTDINHQRTDKFVVTIENNSSVLEEETRFVINDSSTTPLEYPTPEITNLKDFFSSKGIDLSKNYEVITDKYDENDKILYIKLRAID